MVARVPPVRRRRSAGVRRNTALGVPAAAQIVAKADSDSSISVVSGSAWPSGGTHDAFADDLAELALVDALVARDDRQHGAPRRLGAEDQRLGDLGDRATNRRRRVRRRARAGVEFQHLVIGAERGLDS